MSQKYDKPTAPASCFDAIGAMEADNCTPVQLAEVRDIVISEINPATGAAAYGPTGDVSLAASWTSVIDNSSATAAKRFSGEGDIPAAPETTVKVNGVPQPIRKERVLNYDMVSVSPLQEAWLRKAQYGWNGIIWPITRGNRILGGQTGIHMHCVMAEPDYSRGDAAVKVWKLRFVWYELISAPDNESPLTVFN